MRTSRTVIGAVVMAAFGASAALAIEPGTPPDPRAYIKPAFIEEMREVVRAPVIVMSTQAQNDRRRGMTASDIDALDKQWRAQTKADDQPLIAVTLMSPASTYLTQVQARSVGLYSALFVMDRNGLNVGQSVATSDYWQGDEDKFLKTFPIGPDAVFIDAPEYNDDLKIWVAQVNLTVTDGTTPIGAATFEVNLDELRRRALLAR